MLLFILYFPEFWAYISQLFFLRPGITKKVIATFYPSILTFFLQFVILIYIDITTQNFEISYNSLFTINNILFIYVFFIQKKKNVVETSKTSK